MRYAFTFDASACSGCKTCQVACKDKNQLSPGVLWRRVYEVSGGDWEPCGSAWANTVFAYNVSVGCNHCANPACATACPTGAYVVRDDGIVYQEAEKCIGCQYCVWACPYGAPQYSGTLGLTTKCDFCRDLIDEGQAPACVAACPMRALDIVETQREAEAPRRAEAQSGSLRLWQVAATAHPFPLPAVSQTQPSLAVKPHRAMFNQLPRAVANSEEVRTGARYRMPTRGESALVAFTLLGQAAAGTAFLSLFTGQLTSSLLVAIGVLLAVGTSVSLGHLGKVPRAWRAPANLMSSQLSRETVALLLFSVALVVALATPAFGHGALAAGAVAFVVIMTRVYRIEAVEEWNSWRTDASFAASALMLGALATGIVSALSGEGPRAWIWLLAWVLLGVQAWLASASGNSSKAVREGRLVLILLGMLAIALLPFAGPAAHPIVAWLAGLVVVGEEVLGRSSFYRALREKPM